MPKIVDHSLKKLKIAEATWRVVKNLGIKGASVRNIAHESGLSLGALRHYFPDQQDLLIFAMEVVKDRVTARIRQIGLMELEPVPKVLRCLLEMVPASEDSRAEMEVWFEFTFYMKKLHPAVFDAQHDGIYDGIERLLAFLENEGVLKKGLNRQIEAERLYALLDGLALHMLLDEKRLTKEHAQLVLERHLGDITGDLS